MAIKRVIRENCLQDAFALSGLRTTNPRTCACSHNAGGENLTVRSELSYGAYLSSITLANAGLEVIHGIASQLGALVPIPHSIVSGTLLAAATKTTINALLTQKRSKEYAHAFEKDASVGELFGGDEGMSVEEN